MNKIVDERLVPAGEYIDAMNIRMGSTENSEVGVIENTKGNIPLSTITYIDGTPLSQYARCIGAIDDSARETLYWFVHDPAFTIGATGKLDLILSYNILTNALTYHIISIDDSNGVNTTLNFNEKYVITGVNIIGDLLFFTDDYNEPRFININRNYDNPIADVDQFSAESILVIKKPPVESPSISMLQSSGQENYMEERFICFAYRYKYADGEYSATSQWSAPAFIPNPFSLSLNSVLNEGMVNLYNTAIITYNSGGPLVVGIDLLFKNANGNVIKVIEKLDKVMLGLSNNTDYTYTFSNSKIFTILPDSELLRLYDNVPRYAKAQTLMGNRLMYGNYVEGYDLIDTDGQPTRLEYETELVSRDISDSILPTDADMQIGIYTIDGTVSIPKSAVRITLAGIDLVAGATISFGITLEHDSFSNGTLPTTTASTTINFEFLLPRDYISIADLATSVEFQNAIGTPANIKPVYSPIITNPTSCDGITFTDKLNCALPNSLGTYTAYESGITAGFQGVAISHNLFGIKLQLIAMRYVDNVITITDSVYEYYKITASEAFYQLSSGNRSLHSNRSYEIGIVYMDEFNRATTALVSPYNTEFVSCGYSNLVNLIRVNIPTSQRAPSWAKRYKFVCKADAWNYETIYSTFYFIDPDTNSGYILLEGENARKVEDGDRLIVKTDSNGPLRTCTYATVLEKKSQSSGFIVPENGALVPAGVYMKINPNDVSLSTEENAVISPGSRYALVQGGAYPVVKYPMNLEDPATPGMYIDYNVPAGSLIKMRFLFRREGTGDGSNSCEKRIYTLSIDAVSSADYTDMYDWFVNDNIQSRLDDGTQEVGGSNCPITNSFDPTLGPVSTSLCTNYWRFNRDGGTNQLTLEISGTKSCTGAVTYKKKSSVYAKIDVYRSQNLLCFETEPSETLPDVFFENELSFPIDKQGNHLSNGAPTDQSQDIGGGIPAILNTGFFNCFAFGNGVESFKVRDSIVGRDFNLGERVTTVAAQDYKEADRFSDITYSGIYNPESNVNKLNEFNLGLLDYKRLESSFGQIMILDGRETDVLCLQEDKVSYVLAGKNLLSDSAAGSAITSVPEVLGTQIARTEKYGISFNPESYVQWGYDRYFTDAKRGAVIQLKGNAYSNEQLAVISEANMRTWFRDTFNDSFNTQKIGGFDPYMNEYVLATNNQLIPLDIPCLACGVTQTFTVASTEDERDAAVSYCVNAGMSVGDTTVSWTTSFINPLDVFQVIVTYDGVDYDSGIVNSSGSITFPKNSNVVETYTVNIYRPIPSSYLLILDITPSCPVAQRMYITSVVLTNPLDFGKTIHTEYRYFNGMFTSPLQSSSTVFSSGIAHPLVSRYNTVIGNAGTGGFPPEGSIMRIQTNKIVPDTFSFDAARNKFMYLRTSTIYSNNDADITSLISAASVATPITDTNPIFYSEFTVAPVVDGDILYLVWDLRTPYSEELCYTTPIGRNYIDSVCCNCSKCDSACITVFIENPIAYNNDAFVHFEGGLCEGEGPTDVTLKPGEAAIFCIVNSAIPFNIVYGNPSITITECGCGSTCPETCWEYTITENPSNATVEYVSCIDGETKTLLITGGEAVSFCVRINTTPTIIIGTGTLIRTNDCGCCTSLCRTWSVDGIEGITRVQYIDCNGDTQIVNVTAPDTILICALKPFTPTLDEISGTATLSISDNCGCPV
jgi:hypothetical protein